MAKIPLANLLSYSSDLRSTTSGTASFKLNARYERPDGKVQKKTEFIANAEK